jgi:hypothetical protein
MNENTLIQASRKKPLGIAFVVALQAIHGLFLIIIGLIAFLGGFIGVYEVSNGRTTPVAIVAVLGAFVAWILLLEGIVSLLCAYGLWTRQRWAFWLTIAFKSIDLILASCVLRLQLFTPWPIVLSMSLAGGILLYVLIMINPRTLSGS